MTLARRFTTALFDVDGTLIDSNGAHAQSWAEALREHGVAVEADRIRPLIGMGGDKLLPAIAHVPEDSDLGQAVARRKKDIFLSLLPGLQPTRGARRLVEFLRQEGINLAIATSADDRELSSVLEQAGVNDLFSERASKDDASRSKPDPDIVQAALKQSGAMPESTVLIGDTPYDIEAATHAGVETIALRCGGFWADSDLRGAIEIFDDPESLLAHWRT